MPRLHSSDLWNKLIKSLPLEAINRCRKVSKLFFLGILSSSLGRICSCIMRNTFMNVWP